MVHRAKMCAICKINSIRWVLQADGAYGRRTEEAVRIFQRIFGLSADGVAGKATRTRLLAISRAVEAGCLPRRGRIAEEFALPQARVASAEAGANLSGDLDWKREFLEADPILKETQKAPIYSFLPLNIGCKGEMVKRCKGALAEWGYSDFGDLKEEELYTSGTQRAVMEFQIACGLLPTGEVDDSTWEMLFS